MDGRATSRLLETQKGALKLILVSEMAALFLAHVVPQTTRLLPYRSQRVAIEKRETKKGKMGRKKSTTGKKKIPENCVYIGFPINLQQLPYPVI